MSPRREPADKPDDGVFRSDVVWDGEAARVRAIGELDMGSVPALAAEIAQARAAGCTHVVIDLSKLSFLDSSGLRLLLGCHAESRQDGHTIALIPGPPVVQRVFELTRTVEHLPFIASSDLTSDPL